MVYGFAPAVSLRARTTRAFPLRQLHRAFPVDSLRVRWVPLVRAFRRLGAFAMRPQPRVDSFPVLRLLPPSRPCLRHRGCVGGSLPYCPLPFTSFQKLPVFTGEDAHSML